MPALTHEQIKIIKGLEIYSVDSFISGIVDTADELYDELSKLKDKHQQGVDYARALSDELDRKKFELEKIEAELSELHTANGVLVQNLDRLEGEIAELRKFKEAFLAAKKYIDCNVCDPDINKEMIAAWDEYKQAESALRREGKE